MRPHLVDATLFYTPTSGGVRRYLLEKHAWLARNARLRHTLVVPGPVDRGAADGIVEFASPLLRAGYRCPVRLKALRRTVAALEPDLLEASDPYLVAWQVARIARERGIPSAAFCHSDVINLVRKRAGAPGAALTSVYLKTLYGRFDLVFAPSLMVAARLAEASIRHVVVQPLGVDASTFRPGRGDGRLRARLGLAPDARLLVFAGRLAPEKNVPELYALVDRLGDPYHLVVIGGTALERPAPRVTVLPYAASPHELAALIGDCDLLVHAGRQETFGLVALEAMACAVPVVAYDGGALAEIVNDAVGALVAPNGDFSAVVHAQFERDLSRIGAEARRHVLQHYTWDATFRRQLQHYARLLRQGSLLDDAADGVSLAVPPA